MCRQHLRGCREAGGVAGAVAGPRLASWASKHGVTSSRGVREPCGVAGRGVRTWRQTPSTYVASLDVASIRGVRGPNPPGTCLQNLCLPHTILYYTKLCYTILYFTILYYTILYYTILYHTILYYTILYYTNYIIPLAGIIAGY